MNGGNLSRGQADGFGLEILSKLKDVKSKDSQITLLHFIVKSYIKKIVPFTLNIPLPVPEPGDIKRAATVNFDDVKADLEKLHRQLEGNYIINEAVYNAIFKIVLFLWWKFPSTLF